MMPSREFLGVEHATELALGVNDLADLFNDGALVRAMVIAPNE
jgi:hypothetical protein